MAYTQEQLDALKAAYATGVRRVNYNGRDVTYASGDEMLRAIREIEGELGVVCRHAGDPAELRELLEGLRALPQRSVGLAVTWLDSTIGYLSPQAGLRRIRARTAMNLLERHAARRGYEGAKLGRRTDGWMTFGTSDANAEIAGARERLAGRARDLVRNNPYASAGIKAIASNVVGEGIVPRSSKRTDEAWARWGEEADADGLTDIYGLQTLIVRTVVESGEALVLRRVQPPSSTMAIPLKLQVIEGDYLDTSKDTIRIDTTGGWIDQGVEYDARGQRLAYHLFRRHPGTMLAYDRSTESRRVPADEVLHIYDPLRAGQGRGVTWLAQAITKLRDLDDYDEAELVRKKIEACFVAFVFGDDTGETLGEPETDAEGMRTERFEPGMIEYMPSGKNVQFGEPKANGGYAEYMRVQLHAIAAALDLTYELLTKDLSQVNFSSARMGVIQFRQRVRQIQKQILIPQLLLPIWRWFSEIGQVAGVVTPRQGRVPVLWTFPHFEFVQPLQDAQEEAMRLRNGTLTLPEAVAQRGFDYGDVIAEIAASNQLLDDNKIILDSDPRKTAKTGALQAKPAAPGANGNGKPPVDDSTDDDDDESKNEDDGEDRLLLQGIAAELGVRTSLNGHGPRGQGDKR